MLSKQEVRNKYDKFAKFYDLFGIVENFLIGDSRRKLLKNAKGKVLDLACGTGRNFYYYPRNCKITAVDYSSGMLHFAEKRAEKLGRDIALQIADSESLPFSDDSFDTVVDSFALCTYSNPKRALQEMARVCKQEGRIILLEHGKSDRKWLSTWQDKKSEAHARHLGCYWNRNIIYLVKKAGLEILHINKKFFGVFYEIEAIP